MDNATKKQVIALLSEIGASINSFGEFTDSIWLTMPLNENDIAAIKSQLAPNHFNPHGYRGIFVVAYRDGFYITSHVRGIFRGYRCRNESRDFDAGNIFAHGKNILEVTRDFVRKYIALEYNVSK